MWPLIDLMTELSSTIDLLSRADSREGAMYVRPLREKLWKKAWDLQVQIDKALTAEQESKP